MMSYPISLHLQGKKCIVFGAGTIAQRRVQGLLQAGAVVTVVAPESKPICWEHIALTYLQGRYHPELLTDFFLVFAATNDPVINAQIVRASQEKGKLVSTVTTDSASTADFSLPACRSSGAVTLAITTEGTAPALATAIGMKPYVLAFTPYDAPGKKSFQKRNNAYSFSGKLRHQQH